MWLCEGKLKVNITHFRLPSASQKCSCKRASRHPVLVVIINSGTVKDVMGLIDGRRGGLIVSAPDSGSSGPGLSPGRGHCVVFLGKTLYSNSASLHPGV